MTVQSFITVMRQRKKLSIVKIFRCFVSLNMYLLRWEKSKTNSGKLDKATATTHVLFCFVLCRISLIM